MREDYSHCENDIFFQGIFNADTAEMLKSKFKRAVLTVGR